LITAVFVLLKVGSSNECLASTILSGSATIILAGFS
jgi:hypothetical protein